MGEDQETENQASSALLRLRLGAGDVDCLPIFSPISTPVIPLTQYAALCPAARLATPLPFPVFDIHLRSYDSAHTCIFFFLPFVL
jgi:hypothetical protein